MPCYYFEECKNKIIKKKIAWKSHNLVDSKWINNLEVGKGRIITKCLIKIEVKLKWYCGNIQKLHEYFWIIWNSVAILKQHTHKLSCWTTLCTAQQHTKRHETFVFCKFLQVLKFTLYLSRASHYLRITFYICINIFCAWYKKSLCFFSLSQMHRWTDVAIIQINIRGIVSILVSYLPSIHRS